MSDATSAPSAPLAPDAANTLGQLVRRFDEAVDQLLERARGHQVSDHVLQAASDLGDWSVVWLVLGAAWGLTSVRRTDRALRLTLLLGAESLVVNQGVKRLFRRVRPTPAGDPRYPVRRPSTTSFPSGHASAAFFAASLLSEGDPPLAPLWFALAGVVALSRPYVRIHHASDSVAGAATGLVLAALVKRLWPMR